MKDENWDGDFVDLMEQEVQNRSRIRVQIEVCVPSFMYNNLVFLCRQVVVGCVLAKNQQPKQM